MPVPRRPFLAFPRAVAAAAVLLAGFASAASAGEAGWMLSLSAGGALNIPTHLAIEQRGEPDIRLTASYDTRALEPPIYYSLRLGRVDPAGAWEIELIHQKIRLRDPPPEVQRFEISHGYNLLLFGRSWDRRAAVLRAGAGPVISHPETTVRGRNIAHGEGILGKGYYLSGFGVQLAAEKRSRPAAGFALSIEGKLTTAWARVPVADGHADAPNVALHALVGLARAF
ncbi:MAG: hypothetical protein ABIH26_15740 [Candidatus Eisenbacteria bacterium]